MAGDVSALRGSAAGHLRDDRLVRRFRRYCRLGKHHLDVLRRFSEFHYGIPCERWVRKLVNRVVRSCSAAASTVGWRRCGRSSRGQGRSASRTRQFPRVTSPPEGNHLRACQPCRQEEAATTTAYENAYFLDHGAIALSEDNPVQDARALSVRFLIDLVSRGLPTWPPFLLDLLPQGHQRRKLAGHLNLDPDAASTDIHLLMRSAGAPIGNLRIKEAHLQELERAKELPRIGVDKEDILGRTDRFLELVDRSAMQASGSSGPQGDWPKLAMTLERDGKWYPDSIVPDADAVAHVIVKLLRSNDETDRLILAAEAGYAAVAKDLGLTVQGVSEYRDGVLVIPRFDRAVVGGRLVRHGQESLVSALGVAEFGHIDTHENYLAVLRRLSTDPIRDVTDTCCATS